MSFLHLLGFEKNLEALECQEILEKQTSQCSLVMEYTVHAWVAM